MQLRLFLKNRQNCFNMSSAVKITDYDVIGLDLDNTLLEYNLTNLFTLQYRFLSNYLTEKKGYHKTIFHENLLEEDADFIQRGLFLDFARGNILNIRSDGYILQATHGTKKMDSALIEQIYGKEHKWSVTNKLVENFLSVWDCPETRSFLDFTDSVASLLYAKAVDSVNLQGRLVDKVWSDLLEAIKQMYDNNSSFVQEIDSNLLHYMKPCDEEVLQWLQSLKKHAKLILITGAVYERAHLTLPFCLGHNYLDYFETVIYNAKKPGFFNKTRPFLTLNNEHVTDIVLGKEYKEGNWSELYKKLTTVLNKTPKCVYIGDNPLQDIFTPTTISEKMDVIAMIEEVAVEGLYPDLPKHPHSKYISSEFWGSFIHTNRKFTFMGGIIKKSAKLIIPSLKVLAGKPLDYEHKCLL